MRISTDRNPRRAQSVIAPRTFLTSRGLGRHWTGTWAGTWAGLAIRSPAPHLPRAVAFATSRNVQETVTIKASGRVSP
jgi:hypothetical protein